MSVCKNALAMFDGGEGGMQAAAAAVGASWAEAVVAAGGDEQAARRAELRGRKEAMGTLRAATTPVTTKQHLYQVGEYQLQDTMLSGPFEVNAACVVNAYTCTARVTGCRPGMAVNTADDELDEAGPWYEVPPLDVEGLAVAYETLDVGGAAAELLRMELLFKPSRGEYFSSYEFGKAVTVDSDELVRAAPVALAQLLVRTASLRACYARLAAADAAMLRSKTPAAVQGAVQAW